MASLDSWVRLELLYIGRLSPCRPVFDAGQACVRMCYILNDMHIRTWLLFSKFKAKIKVEIQGICDHIAEAA